MSYIIYVGPDMLGYDAPSLYNLDERLARQSAEEGHHYFFYDGEDLEWLKPFDEARMAALTKAMQRRGLLPPDPKPRVVERMMAALKRWARG